MADIRNCLEKEEKLDEWIDLIFGIKQEKDENQRDYYEKERFVTFENKDDILNNEILMQSTDFGLIPYKIFNTKFPVIKRDNIDNLKIYNKLMIENDHFVDFSNIMKCCVCIGRTSIDKDYLDFYENKKLSEDNHYRKNKLLDNFSLIKKLKDINEFCFYFVGDIFGNVTIYRIENKIPKKKNKSIINKLSTLKNTLFKKKDKNQEGIELKKLEESNLSTLNNDKKEKEIKEEKKVENILEKNEYVKLDKISDDNIFKYSIFKKLYDHNKQIKYIDFNGRLNIFVTYSLDEYINVYLFPSCKFINAIKVSKFAGKQCIFNKVLLISNPYPMIFCCNDKIIYILSINGNVIHVESIDDDKKIELNIDKNCGIIQDFLSKDGVEYSFPFINKIDVSE